MLGKRIGLSMLMLGTAIAIGACEQNGAKSSVEVGTNAQATRPETGRDSAQPADGKLKLQPLTAANPTQTATTDNYITAQVMVTLDNKVPDAHHIVVDTKDGVVTLRGEVHTKLDKAEIIQLVSAVDGVREVQADQLIIKGPNA